MNTCLLTEKNRIKQKEQELRDLVMGVKVVKQPQIQEFPKFKEEAIM